MRTVITEPSATEYRPVLERVVESGRLEYAPLSRVLLPFALVLDALDDVRLASPNATRSTAVT
jgi:hypothetical protein